MGKDYNQKILQKKAKPSFRWFSIEKMLGIRMVIEF